MGKPVYFFPDSDGYPICYGYAVMDCTVLQHYMCSEWRSEIRSSLVYPAVDLLLFSSSNLTLNNGQQAGT